MNTNESLKVVTFKELLLKAFIELGIFIIIGLTGGYLVNREGNKENEVGLTYFWVVFLFFTCIGIILFIIKLIKALKYHHRG